MTPDGRRDYLLDKAANRERVLCGVRDAWRNSWGGAAALLA